MPQTDNEARILLALQAYKNDPELSLRRAAKLYQVNFTTFSADITAYNLELILFLNHANYLI